MTLYMPGGPLGKVFKRAGTIAAVLFLPNSLGISLIPYRPSFLACQNQCKK